MTVLKRMQHVLLWLCIMTLGISQPVFYATAEPEQPTVKDVSTVIGDNAVSYPQLEGLSDEKIQQAINNSIVEKAKIAQRMVTLSTLKSGSSGLQVRYEAYGKYSSGYDRGRSVCLSGECFPCSPAKR